MERPTALVVDASIAVKWFVPEADSPAALKVRESHMSGDVSLFAPDLLTYELFNALRFKASLTNHDLEASIESLFNLDVALIAPTAAAISQAASLARTLGFSIYDAVYLVLARDLDCRFVTSDVAFYEKVHAHDSDRAILLKDYMPAQNKDEPVDALSEGHGPVSDSEAKGSQSLSDKCRTYAVEPSAPSGIAGSI